MERLHLQMSWSQKLCFISRILSQVYGELLTFAFSSLMFLPWSFSFSNMVFSQALQSQLLFWFKMGSLYNNVDTYLQIGSGRVLVCSGEEARLCIISAVYQRVSCLNSEGRNSCYIHNGHLKTLSALRL